jgi:fructose-1,6-bisphosphatase
VRRVNDVSAVLGHIARPLLERQTRMSAAENNMTVPARNHRFVTLQGHILQQQEHHPEATGTFSLGGREGVAIVASEENEEPVILRTDLRGEQKYCVLFDPLDGSSNLAVESARSSASCARIGARLAPRTRCCNPAASRSPPATCSTGRRPCSR